MTRFVAKTPASREPRLILRQAGRRASLDALRQLELELVTELGFLTMSTD
jgi:hypothetical protein